MTIEGRLPLLFFLDSVGVLVFFFNPEVLATVEPPQDLLLAVFATSSRQLKQKTIDRWARMCPPPLSLSASAYPHAKQITGEVIGTVTEKYKAWSLSYWTLGC